MLPLYCSDESLATNVLIEDSRITAIDPAIQTEADEVVDAKGLHLIPGVIDDQVHFRDPGLTHKEDLHTGSLACAKGGVTTFLEMPNTKPPTITCKALEEKLADAGDQVRGELWLLHGSHRRQCRRAP